MVVELLKSNVIFQRFDNVIGTNQLKNHNVFSILLDKRRSYTKVIRRLEKHCSKVVETL